MELARQQRRPVMSYNYDELIFNEPTEAMLEILTSRGSARLPTKAQSKGRGEFVVETEALELDRLGEGVRIVQEHIKQTKDKLSAKERELQELREELAKLEANK